MILKTPIILPQCQNPKVPEATQFFYHSQELQLRFNDIDIVGHLNNSIYFQFMDLGKTSYFQAIMPEKVKWNDVPVVIVNVNCNFYSPTYLDEKIVCLTATTRISERSLQLEQRIVNPATGDVKCVATCVMAGFDVKTAKGAPIDEIWAEAIKKFEGMN